MLRHLLCLLAAQAALVAAKDEKPCTAYGEQEEYFDLSALKASKDYTFKSPGGREFTINVCRSVVSDVWNPQNVERPDDIAAYTRGDRGDFSLGSVNTTLAVQDQHPLLLLQDGSSCPGSDSMKAATAIRFICDRRVFGSGTPQLIAQLPPEDDAACAFFIEWRTHYACPTGKAGGFGFIFLLFILLFALGFLFLIAGILWRRFALGLRGFDQLPSMPSFGCPSFFSRLKDKLPGRFGGNDPYDRYGSAWSGWDRLPVSAEEANSMLGPDGPEDETPRQSLENGHGHAAAHNPWGDGNARPAGVNPEGVIRL